MRFDTWNVRSLYRSGSLVTVVGELARYKLNLEGVQELDGTKQELYEQGIIRCYMEKGMIIINWGQGFSYTREYYQQ
jgi:hypothetical protein